MKIAYLFPGQGSETPRMGLALAETSAKTRSYLQLASTEVGLDLFRVLARGGRDFARTEVLQPALTAVCLGALHELERVGVRPDVVAGHSLGELSAWCAIGCVSPEETIKLAVVRGRLMANEASSHPGGMRALSGCDQETVGRVLAHARARGIVDLAAHNAPQQWVLSGDESALRALSEVVGTNRLVVSGPWHSRLMQGAVEPLGKALAAMKQTPSRVPLVANRNGRIPDRDEDIPMLLVGQLCSPIRWATTMRTLAEMGVTDIITLGPGRVLRGLTRQNLGTVVRVHSAETPTDVGHLIETVA